MVPLPLSTSSASAYDLLFPDLLVQAVAETLDARYQTLKCFQDPELHPYCQSLATTVAYKQANVSCESKLDPQQPPKAATSLASCFCVHQHNSSVHRQGCTMTGPGSVQMTDADEIIEIFTSDEEDCRDEGSDQGSDQAGSMSEGSDEYNYSSDDASDGLADDERPVSTSERRAPYRIIDGEALKQVQVGHCFCRQSASS